MDILANPALLGGMMICVALGAWLLGRRQGQATAERTPEASKPEAPVAAARLHPAPETAPASPCQQQARAERLSALGQTASLVALHAEVSAYRQRERILAALPEDASILNDVLVTDQPDCRYVGLTGQPTCGLPSAALPASGCGGSCRKLGGGAMRPDPMDQLVPERATFTRV